MPCPETFTVDGREFGNYAGESLPGTPTFFKNFTASCNTAFVSLADELGDDDLTNAAKTLGIGAGWADTLGVADAFEGSVPATSGGTDAAAASIGQGRVEVSPLALAVMSGSIGRGNFLAPVLVKGSEPTSPRPSPIDGRAVAELRAMMLGVVASGTGTEARGAPGGPVRGKTGSAEHGTDPDVPPHVWFTGYQDDVAFTVLVEEGTSGGTVAAPIAKDFLTAGRHPLRRTRTTSIRGSERPRPDAGRGLRETRGCSGQIARTWSACGPLGPCVTSNSTRWASSRLR